MFLCTCFVKYFSFYALGKAVPLFSTPQNVTVCLFMHIEEAGRGISPVYCSPKGNLTLREIYILFFVFMNF